MEKTIEKRINWKLIRTGLMHLAFWIVIWFFFFYFFSFNSNVKVYVTWFSSLLMPPTMATTYFMVYYLIPRYLLKRDYFKFVLYTFYTLVASSNIIVLTLYGCLIFLLKFDITLIPPMSKNYLFILILVYLVVGLVSFINLLQYNFETVSRNKALENKILDAQLQLKEQELQYLKMQIHPHFLFNTLNTIYGLALKQSAQTTDVILKLSNLLDYILYQVNKPKVSLKEELLHIKEYTDLEKIRFRDTLKVDLTLDDMAETTQLAPMLLIPLVENAFKHGSIVNNYLSVIIEANLSGDHFTFAVANTFNAKNISSQKHGIGLENIKKRLELNYLNNYKLETDIQEQWYKTTLTIFNINSERNG